MNIKQVAWSDPANWMTRLKGFKKNGFDMNLGSILVPELREYYRVKRFAFLEEKLSFLTPAPCSH